MIHAGHVQLCSGCSMRNLLMQDIHCALDAPVQQTSTGQTAYELHTRSLHCIPMLLSSSGGAVLQHKPADGQLLHQLAVAGGVPKMQVIIC